MNLEHDLRQALKRKEPPPGFRRGVLNKIGIEQTVKMCLTRQRDGAASRFLIAASLMLLAGGGEATLCSAHARTRRRNSNRSNTVQTAQAAHDVMLALQIASEKVSAVQAKVQEMTHHERQND